MHDRRGLVVLVWLGVLIAGGAIASAVGSDFRTEFKSPGESEVGFDLLEEHFGEESASMFGSIVYRAEQGVDDPVVVGEMTEFFDAVDGLDDVSVTSPYSLEGQLQIATEGDEAGRIAYAKVAVPRDFSVDQGSDVADAMWDLAPEIEGVQIEIGGEIFAEFEPPASEVIGIAFAVVILILAFGSVLAMGLPIGTALAGIGLGSMLVMLSSNFLAMPDFTSTMSMMIGLGVGIDYALFIVTRYREELHRGRGFADATAVAIDTAGRAVLFAGTTVVISLLGMLIIGLDFINGLSLGTSAVVAVTMLASVTLLPALLGFAAHRVEVTRWRGLIAAGLVALALLGVGAHIDVLLVALPLAAVVVIAGFFVGPLRKQLPPRPPKPADQTVAFRWSRFVQAHPSWMVVLGLTLLVVLALPVFALRLGFSDEGNYPEDTTTRRAYDLLSQGFGPGFNGQLIVVSEVPDGVTAETLIDTTEALCADEGIELAVGPIPADLEDPLELAGMTQTLVTGDCAALDSLPVPDGLDSPEAVLWQITPTTAPQAAETGELVDRLRNELLPQTMGESADPVVTGFTAVAIDFSQYLGDRIPMFFTVVLVLSFLLLMAVFRSLLVPLKAVIMNLLSIGAAYGLVVAVFQWGWFGDQWGIEPAPIEPFIPMMLFAIVFGLSMDYEVFLLSRVKEEYDRTGDNAGAVADGLASTARVITAAAAIMVFIFGSFLLEDNRIVKLFGLGLALAVFLDATVVRMLLVPATMELLGDRNWWLPRWLDRILPDIHVEGHTEAVEIEPPEEDQPDAEREPVGV
ncbi:MAG: MMPL family transporter [Actinobacteria bacterium]|nr:MAG: MMPL family transporter [Actinomycetota bacterium]RIK04330.1 MAG: MMPL family transporter [Acidobacteriota bacterium]